MNRYFVIGNPISHSLSPLIHNYWFEKYNLTNSNYEKKKLKENELVKFVEEIRDENNYINGANVTVPYKSKIIPFLDKLDPVAKETNSVNTIYKKDGKLIGDNTDQIAFRETIKELILSNKDTNVFLIGAGGVASSVLFALRNLVGMYGKIYLTNRTKSKAIDLENSDNGYLYVDKPKTEVLDWGEVPNATLVINTTSVGLIKGENMQLDFTKYEKLKKKTLFYDLIYNPKETNFIADARRRGNKTMNGKQMFLLQAKYSFQTWTGINAEIDEEIMKIVD